MVPHPNCMCTKGRDNSFRQRVHLSAPFWGVCDYSPATASRASGNVVKNFVVDAGRKYYIATTSDSDGMMIGKSVSGLYKSK